MLPDNDPNPAADSDKMMKGEAPGGIDLNPNLIEMKSTGQKIEFQIPPELLYLQTTPINGLVPVIINIVPVTNVPLLLGEVDREGNPTKMAEYERPEPFIRPQLQLSQL